MTGLFEAAWVIARRDFVATVYSRSFILFLLAPLLLVGFTIFFAEMTGEAENVESHPIVAVAADSATVTALAETRARLAAGTDERIFPVLHPVQPAENVPVQARRLLADEEEGYSAVLSGTLDRPVLTGPAKIEESVGARVKLLLDEARRTAALDGAGVAVPPVIVERDVTDHAAGNLQQLRRQLGRLGQGLIFSITLMLATLLLSNLVEEKSNKVIEVLAAAVPLDSIFLGKLIAMLGISSVGLVLWSGILGLGFLFVQVLQDWMALPQVTPAVGWPAFAVLLLLYYAANFMLLGSLFLGIGAQASNIREIQTISMPVTLLQVMVFLLAMSAVGGDDGALAWFAYLFPFSSPMAMTAFAAESDLLWPHLAALLWQAAWIVLIIRISSRLFRKTVLKSGSQTSFLRELRSWRA